MAKTIICRKLSINDETFQNSEINPKVGCLLGSFN